MENPIFAKLTQINFSPANQSFCVGTWKNYAVALQRLAGRSYYVFLAIRTGNAKALKKTLKAAVKESGNKKLAVPRVMPNFVQAQFSFGKAEDELSDFTACLDFLTAVLQSNGVGPAGTCAVTGAANPDSLCLLTDANFFGYQPVCASAVRQSGYEIKDRVEENENNGSYLTGLIGAILGMLVGVGVNLLTLVFLQRYYVMLFALVPVAAMFGYKLFKGKMDKIAIIIVIVLSVIAVPLMEFLTFVFSLMREYEAPFKDAFEATREIFFEPEITKETVPEMLKMLLFMALGVFIAWSFMARQMNSVQAKAAQVQLDSMRPNPNSAAAQAPQAETTQIPQPVNQPENPQQWN